MDLDLDLDLDHKPLSGCEEGCSALLSWRVVVVVVVVVGYYVIIISFGGTRIHVNGSEFLHKSDALPGLPPSNLHAV